MKKPRSFRIDPDLLDKADKAGINLAPLFEAAIARFLKVKRCPYCLQKIDEKRQRQHEKP